MNEKAIISVGDRVLKLVLIPPYFNTAIGPTIWHHEIVTRMEKRGQLNGVQIDFDNGYPTDYVAGTRDADFQAIISVGVLKKIREYSEMGKHDCMIISGPLEPGFFAALSIATIPVVYTMHSALHMASFIGERIGIIDITDTSCQIVRRCVESHGLGHKVPSIRAVGHTSTYLHGFLKNHKKEDRIKVKEGQKIVQDITAQCLAAIDKERVDTLVFGCPGVQAFEDEVHHELDKVGYGEVQIVSEIPAGIVMASALVNSGLKAASRAYPGADLKAKPEFR